MSTRGSLKRDVGVYNLQGINDAVPSAAAALSIGGTVLLRRQCTATGAAGLVVDYTCYAAGRLPFQFRVVKAWSIISVNAPGTVARFFTQAAAGGTQLTELSMNAAGYVDANNTLTASAEAVPGATEGLFLNVDRSVTSEFYLIIQRTQ